MSFPAALSFAAAYFSLIMAAAVLLQNRNSLVHRLFAIGMVLFAGEEILRGLSVGALPADVMYWQKRVIAFSSLIPIVWFGFSLSYARVNAEGVLSRWKWLLLGGAIAPLSLVAIFRTPIVEDSMSLVGAARWAIALSRSGLVLQCFFLVVSVLILFNLEQTIRSSIGRIRWQIKFVVLGVGGLFALRIYLSSQSLLYTNLDTGFGMINAVALLAANVLFALAMFRGSSLNADVYLSSATIRNSFTVVLVGIYLIAIGLLARLAQYATLDRSLPLDGFIVFIALTCLAVLLLSNRLRRKLRVFVSRHLRRPIYDYHKVWMDLTARTTSLVDVGELSAAVSKMVSESLDVLSVSVWLVDESRRRLTLEGSTALSGVQGKALEKAGKSAPEFIDFLQDRPGCHDLENRDFAWLNEIERAGGKLFHGHRLRYVVGLHAGGELVGIMTLNDDRIGGENDLSDEDVLLLETLADQLAASLLNLKLSARLRHAKELEAFQTVSTFFVHDLKNVASRLSLTMQNLPSNFDNPEFRDDALRVISGSLLKIDDMCGRLGMLKSNVELILRQCDLNDLVAVTLKGFESNLAALLEQDLKPVGKTSIDAEQIQKVLTNLVINANEAVNGNGLIRVATIQEDNAVGFSVSDNGCGMSEEFIENSLFRPFKTTKKKGLGIGLFHCKQIVEAHHGIFEVASTPGTGSEFRVMFPVKA